MLSTIQNVTITLSQISDNLTMEKKCARTCKIGFHSECVMINVISYALILLSPSTKIVPYLQSKGTLSYRKII